MLTISKKRAEHTHTHTHTHTQQKLENSEKKFFKPNNYLYFVETQKICVIFKF